TPPPVKPPPYDYAKEAAEFRAFGGAFADNQLGCVTLHFGDGLYQRFRFIYNPQSLSVGWLRGPRVESFGCGGYSDMGNDMRTPSPGESFDEWIRGLMERTKTRRAIRMAANDWRIVLQSANRLGLSKKRVNDAAKGDDTARMNVRKEDETPVEIADITYSRTDYRSHYDIDLDIHRTVYFGLDVWIR